MLIGRGQATPGTPATKGPDARGQVRVDAAGTARTIVFTCAVPAAPAAEFYIYEIGSGTGTAGALRYCQAGQCPPPGR